MKPVPTTCHCNRGATPISGLLVGTELTVGECHPGWRSPDLIGELSPVRCAFLGTDLVYFPETDVLPAMRTELLPDAPSSRRNPLLDRTCRQSGLLFS